MALQPPDPYMSRLQAMTEGRSLGERQPDPDATEQTPDGSEDALRQAEAERLQRYELERAAEEGMDGPSDPADEDPDIA
jgi:hypothetical protein